MSKDKEIKAKQILDNSKFGNEIKERECINGCNGYICPSPKTVIKHKVWNVEIIEFSDGTSVMNRRNYGFNISELMGLASFLQMELVKQFDGDIKPDVINREVVLDEEEKLSKD